MDHAIHPSRKGYSHFNREESLLDDFEQCVKKIEQDQQILIPSGFICDYLALGWLELRDGLYHLTHAGSSAMRRRKLS
jgi:hypothetical protein